MPSLEMIKLITIKGRAEGVDKVTTSLDRLAASQDKVTVASDRSSRATLSLENAWQKTQRQFDASYRSQEAFAKVQRDVQRFEDQGIGTTARRNEVLQLAEQKLLAVTRANDNFARSHVTASQGTELASHQLQNLTFQLQDIGVSLAGGQNPLMVLAQQGTQIAGIFGPGVGVTGILRGVWAGLNSLVPLSVGIGAGFLAAGLIGTKAFNGWEESSIKVRGSLLGTGQAVGLTTSGLEDLARESARTAGISVSSARDIATGLAITGRAGAGDIQAVIGRMKDFSATLTGGDVSKATEMAAKIFTSPSAAIDELNPRLGFATAGLRDYVKELEQQGRFSEAGRATFDALSASLGKYSDLTSGVRKGFDSARHGVSDFLDTIERGAGYVAGGADALGLNALNSDLAAVKAQLPEAQRAFEAAQKAREALSKGGAPQWLADTIQPISDYKSNLESLAQKHEDLTARVVRAEQQQVDAIRRGTEERTRASRERAEAVVIDLQKANDLLRLNPLQQQQVRAQQEAGLYEGIAKPYVPYPPARPNFGDDPFSISLGADARPGMAGKLSAMAGEMDRYTAGIDRTTLTPADILARATAEEKLAGAERETQRATVDKLTADRLSIQQNQMLKDTLDQGTRTFEAEAAAIGKSAGESERLRTEAALLNQATRGGIPATDELRVVVEKTASTFATLTQRMAEARLENQIRWDRDQIGRTASEQTIANQLRPTFGDDLSSSAAEAAAAQLRLNAALKDTKDLSMQVAQGFVSDMRQGVTATEGLVNALNRVADKLISMALDKSISTMFGGGGLGGLITGMFSGPTSGAATGNFSLSDVTLPSSFSLGFDAGGFTGHGGKYEPAGIVHRGEFVMDAASTARIGIANLEAMRRAPGYADGGPVRDPVWRNWPSPAGAGASRGGSPIIINSTVENHGGAKVKQETTEGPNGEINIKTMIEEAVASSASTQGAPVNRSIRQTFGAQQQLVRRG